MKRCRFPRFVNGVHAECISAFLRLRLLRDFEQRFEILFGRGHGSHFRRFAAIRQVLENAFSMSTLLAVLFDKILAKALEIPDIAPHGKRQIGMRGSQFLIELAV